MRKRIELVKAMNTIIKDLNNEDAYYKWVTVVPDEATDDDFEDIAACEKCLDEVSRLFVRLVITYGKDGFYVGDDKESGGNENA